MEYFTNVWTIDFVFVVFVFLYILRVSSREDSIGLLAGPVHVRPLQGVWG